MADEVKPEVLNEEALLELKNDALVTKAREEFNYPASIATKKSNKDSLVEMILAGSFPNEKFQEMFDVEVTQPMIDAYPEELEDAKVGEIIQVTKDEQATLTDLPTEKPVDPTPEPAGAENAADPVDPKPGDEADRAEAVQDLSDGQAEEAQPDPVGSADFEGFDMLVPADARIVFGGPVIKGKPHPFGFSVGKELTDKEMEKYGTGKGVTYHCKQGTAENPSFTYKIAY